MLGIKLRPSFLTSLLSPQSTFYMCIYLGEVYASELRKGLPMCQATSPEWYWALNLQKCLELFIVHALDGGW